MSQPTLNDVAKVAKVSATTVSRVINRRGYLSKETIAKVEAAMKKLNYRPNIIAKQLQAQRTMAIGILVPTIANPFFGQLTYELERRFFKSGFRVMIGNAENDIDKERKYLQQLLARQVDGLVIATHNHQQQIPEYQHTNMPIVSIDRYLRFTIPNISSDNYQGGRQATQALLDRGARHILHTDSEQLFDRHDYLCQQAYEDVMKEHGLTPHTYGVDFGSTREDKLVLFNKLFTDYPAVDGIFASNDMDAILLLQVAQQRGIKVPDDLQIIGYDGVPTTRMMVPELATMEQPIGEIAQQAVKILQREINHQPVKDSYKLPVKFLPAASVKRIK